MKTWRTATLLQSTLICLPMMASCQTSTETDNSGTQNTGLNSEVFSAEVSAATFNGEPGNYTFSVTVRSPDTGCEQYADWWEVLSADGELIYRRILAHSHVDEQPFTRSGGPVIVAADENIIVRAHMNNAGYGEQVFTGSPRAGLTMSTLSASFAQDLQLADPLPGGCAF